MVITTVARLTKATATKAIANFQMLKARLPQLRIVLLSMFPRADHPIRYRNTENYKLLGQDLTGGGMIPELAETFMPSFFAEHFDYYAVITGKMY